MESNFNIQKQIPKIQVCIRKRPSNKNEIEKNDIDIIEIPNENSIKVKELK
jgi:hypothetical protein